MIEYKEVEFSYRTCKGYEKVVWPMSNICYYCLDGELHREDGPAKIWPDGRKEYWLNGIQIFPSNYHLFSPLELARLGLI